MTDTRRRLEPLQLDPPKPIAGASPTGAVNQHRGGQPVGIGPPAVGAATGAPPGAPRASLAIIGAIVVAGLFVLAAAGIGGFLLLREDRTSTGAGTQPNSPQSRSTTTAAVANDGTDGNHPILPDVDRGFVDTRGGWGWGDKCWLNIKAGRWGWAKAECDEGMKRNPASPQPRASLLYNEGLIAKGAGNFGEARADFMESLVLREHPEVRGALDSLPAR
jgi:hypothetical protein